MRYAQLVDRPVGSPPCIINLHDSLIVSTVVPSSRHCIKHAMTKRFSYASLSYHGTPEYVPSDVAVEDGVIVVAARTEGQEVLCCSGDLFTEDLQLEVSQVGVQCH